MLADTALPDEAKVRAGWLMHRFDSSSLVAIIAAATMAEDLGWSVSKVTRAVRVLREAPWINVRKGRLCNCYSPAFDLVEPINGRLALIRAARRARYPRRKPNPGKAAQPN